MPSSHVSTMKISLIGRRTRGMLSVRHVYINCQLSSKTDGGGSIKNPTCHSQHEQPPTE